MPASGLTPPVLRSAVARWKPICAATMPQVTVGCTPEPVIMMPERMTLSPSRLVIALAHSSSVLPSSGNLAGSRPASLTWSRLTSGWRLIRSIGTMKSWLSYFG